MSESTGLADRSSVLRWAGTLLALALLAYLLSRQGWSEFGQAIRQIPLSTFALVLVLTVISRLAVAGRWASLLILSGVPMPISQILKITFAGMFASNFLPTSVGGDIVRFAGTIGIDKHKRIYASSIVMDRLIGALGMATLVPVGIASVIAGPEWPAIKELLETSPIGGSIAGSAGAGSLIGRIGRWATLGWETVKVWLRLPWAIVLAFCFTWFVMLLKFVSLWLLFRSSGQVIGFWKLSGLWTFVYFISLFPISINGIGLQEVSAGLIYSTLGGVGETSVLAAAILLRTAEMIASLPGAIALPTFLDKPEAKIGVDAERADPAAVEERLD